MSNSSDGYTLIEVLLAIIIMGFFLLAINTTFYAVNNFNYISRQRNYAVGLSQQMIEIIQGENLNLVERQGKNNFKDFIIFSGLINDSLINRFDNVLIEIDKFKRDNHILADLYQINIKVDWIYRGRSFSYNLSSLVYNKDSK